MNRKIPARFSNHEEWLSYVHSEIPVSEQPYVLACGRTEFFKKFYEVRKEEFPVEFSKQLEHIRELSEPERTRNLESLNERIFANLRMFLRKAINSKTVAPEGLPSNSRRKQVQGLLDHLEKENPYFGLWVRYKERFHSTATAEGWKEFLECELETTDNEETAFALAMAELGNLLIYFLDRDLQLPRYFAERTSFLHRLCGPERMLQTRALLNTLTAEMGACTSA